MRHLLIGLSFLLCFIAHAQHGPRVGLGLATQSVGGLFQNTSNLLVGPVIGWHFEGKIHPQFSIMPEVLYLNKGYSFRNPAQASRSRTTMRYLEVPVLAKISLDQQPDGIYLLVGPSVGYFLSGRHKTWQENQLLYDQRYSFPSTGRRLDFSALVGMGIEGPRWAFDGRAQTSLTPFERFQRLQNIVYSFTVAYRLGGDRDRKEPEEDDR